jgi:hypothetical protein
MIIEKRRRARDPRFLEIFHSKTIPAHREIGMKVMGPFNSVENPDPFGDAGLSSVFFARADETKVP